jgi:hypothetical protein
MCLYHCGAYNMLIMANSPWGSVAAGLIGAAIAILGYKLWDDASETQKRAFLDSVSKLRLCTPEQMNLQNQLKQLR